MAETLPGHGFILKQSTSFARTFFFGTASQTVAVTLSKNGAAFAGAAGAVAEVGGAGAGNGWYTVTLTTADTNTAGILAYHATATTGGPADFADIVRPQIFADLAIAGGVGTQRALVSSNCQQGQAIAGFPFTMTSVTTGAPLTGLTVSAQRYIGGFSPCSNAPFEIGNGDYAINLSGSDTNAPVVLYRFTAPAANDVNITVIMQP